MAIEWVTRAKPSARTESLRKQHEEGHWAEFCPVGIPPVSPTLGKDIVPLVDNCELQESDEGRSEVIEIVLAVAVVGELRVLQSRVPTYQGTGGGEIGAQEMDFAMEHLHPDDGEHIIYHLVGELYPSEATGMQAE